MPDASLCDALRSTTTLTSLTLSELQQLAPPVVAALLGALTAHRSLQALDFTSTQFEDAAAAGQALAALLAANAPALTELHMRGCGLGEAGVGALLDGLPRNTHLRVLDISNSRVPAGFLAARLLPAVRANTGLRKLLADDDDESSVEEAQRIIATR